MNDQTIVTGKPDPDDAAKQVYQYRSITEILMPYIVKLVAVWKIFLAINGSVFLLTLLYNLLFVDPVFRSAVTIFPSSGTKSSGGLGSLAALTGISLDGGGPMDVYENLLTSEAVFEHVVYSKYKTLRHRDSVNLIQYFGIKPDGNIDSSLFDRSMFYKTYELLLGMSSVERNEKTNMIEVSVTMREPKLSSDIVNNIVQSLDIFMRTKRITGTILQRSYIEQRLIEVKDSLNEAENELKVFQISNRNISSSPILLLEQSRLNLKVQILREVYVDLSRQFEISKFDEIRDSPVVSVREYSKVPLRKAGPSLLKPVAIMTFLSLFATSFYFLFFEDLQRYVKGTLLAFKTAAKR